MVEIALSNTEPTFSGYEEIVKNKEIGIQVKPSQISKDIATEKIKTCNQYTQHTIATNDICVMTETKFRHVATITDVKNLSTESLAVKNVSNKSVQTSVEVRNSSTMTEKVEFFEVEDINKSNDKDDSDFDIFNSTYSSTIKENPSDTSFSVSNVDIESSEESSEEENCTSKASQEKNKAYIVFWSMLLQLFNFCLQCKNPAHIEQVATRGSLLVVSLVCIEGHLSQWRSQPLINSMAAGNLIVSGSIFFTGNSFTRIKEMFDAASIPIMSKSVFMQIQKQYVIPVVNYFYQNQRLEILNTLKNVGTVDLIGDGRCDSPGFNAKYETYSFMDPLTDKIIDFEIVNVSEASSSVVMEKIGFLRLLEKVEKKFNLDVRSITTDRHIQIRAYLLHNRKDIIHQFDIWHVCKSIKKNLFKKAKTDESLHPWIRSITNHFWWCCKTCEGNPKLLHEKWISVLHHVRNKHSWKRDSRFELLHKCAHKRLPPTSNEDIVWLEEGTPAYNALEKVVLDKRLLKDFAYLTEYRHTGQIEVYHSVVNKYCPKRQHFHMASMLARQQLAAMDHNCGTDLAISVDKEGEPVCKYQYSKITKQWVAKPVKEQKNREYLKDMVIKLIELKEGRIELQSPELPLLPRNIASTPRPDKNILKKNLRSRFT